MALDDEKMLTLLAPEYRAYIERSRAEAYHPSLSELPVTDARKFMRDMQQADVSRYPVTVERHSLDCFSVLILKPASAMRLLTAQLRAALYKENEE